MFDLRLIRADALKLGRRYGMVAISMLLTLGVTGTFYAVQAVQHLSNASRYGPAGGTHNYQSSIRFLGLMIFIVAAIVGSTAGSQDIETGVFRDLAATGRRRVALFSSRIAGAIVIVVPVVALTALLTAALSFAFAGPLAAPSVGTITSGTLSLLASGTLGCIVAVGLAALVGSRGPVIAMLLAFELAISPLLLSIGFLGAIRQVIPANALDRIADAPRLSVPTTLVTAIIVLLAWAGAACAAGAWRTKTQEI